MKIIAVSEKKQIKSSNNTITCCQCESKYNKGNPIITGYDIMGFSLNNISVLKGTYKMLAEICDKLQ